MSSSDLATDRDDAADTPRNLSWTIFLISAVGLLLEMMLIRWIGTEIRIFAYLQNTVLIVCFLGLGMGCFTCRKPIQFTRSLIALLALTIMLSIPLLRGIAGRITEFLSSLGDLVIWAQAVSDSPLTTVGNVTLGLIMTFYVMVMLWEVFVPLGRILGRAMDDHPRTIRAYSINVAGSLVGIWLFVLLSAMGTPPIIWLLVAGAMLLLFLGSGAERKRNLGFLAATIAVSFLAGREPSAVEVAWSPYQKLSFGEQEDVQIWAGTNVIRVNNTGYQGLFDLSDEGVRNNPRIPEELYGLSQYDLPTLFHPNPDKVLIVGAGSGNDVAGALRGGAKEVTAVEIDPAIIELGRRHHPERPYDSPRVRVVNDDARSFFAMTDQKFDVIVFGLLDSHTTTAMTNARLDHYVYTRESIARARSLLNEGGVVVLSFEATKQFIADRMARVIRDTFDAEPLSFIVAPNPTGWGGLLFVAGDRAVIDGQLAINARLAEHVEQLQSEYPIEYAYTTRVTSDDWPYIYLETPWIPSLYYLLGGLMLALVIYSSFRLQVRGLFGGWSVSHWHFFFLGAAFLLLEVQNISKASVALGNTWLVNAVIISGILLMILLANFVAAKFPRLPRNAVVACLIGSCLALYFVDLSRFAFLPFAPKALVIGLLTTLPMLFSGIIFIDSFAKVRQKDLALGANLIGALVGGMLQSITFVIGIKALLIVVAGLYACAMIFAPRATPADGGRDDDGVAKEQDDQPRSDVAPDEALAC
jgi:spermidine synthase